MTLIQTGASQISRHQTSVLPIAATVINQSNNFNLQIKDVVRVEVEANNYHLFVCLLDLKLGILAILHTHMGACAKTDEYHHNMNSPRR